MLKGKEVNLININPILAIDSYKLGHMTMYPKGTTKIYCNAIPRSLSRLEALVPEGYFDNKMVTLGTTIAVKEIHQAFENNFFKRDIHEIILEFKETIAPFIGDNSNEVLISNIIKLYGLGYLPLEFKCLPEGMVIPAQTPVLTVTNTHEDFAWLPNYLETFISNSFWKISTSATIARIYKNIFTKFSEETCDNNLHITFQGHDFSARGMSGMEDSIKTGLGHLTYFQGSDSIHSALLVKKLYGCTDLIAASVPACYDDITEVLTDNGFKLFKDLTKEDKVAQYLEDGTIEFVKPTAYYNMPYKGKMVRYYSNGYSYVDCVVTPNHKMVRLNKTKGIQLFEAGYKEESKTTGYNTTNSVVISGILKGVAKLSPMEQLAIAFQADGALPNRSEAYKSGQIRFSLKKQRKIDRLDNILSALSLDFSKSNKDKKGYVSYWIKTNEHFFDKEFSWVKLCNGDTWAKAFINELQFWDGTIKGNCIVYSNTNELAIKKVLELCAVSGYKSQYSFYFDNRGDRLLQYTVVIQDKQAIYGKGVKREFIDYDSTVHCVSVPSKMIITKRNNRVIICGNTEHSVMCLGSSNESEVETFRRLIKQYDKGIVSIVSDTWDFWDTITNKVLELKEDILNRTEDSLGLSKLVFRPDSGDPVKVICGDKTTPKGSPEYKGAIECLWDIFGGTTNAKQYKVLNSKVGLIYGDAITFQRAVDILEGLRAKGFASSNVVLGIGSYAYNYVTRDTLGYAIKATYAEIQGKAFDIAKAPKTDSGKKSMKGLLQVVEAEGQVITNQQVSWLDENDSILTSIYKDGVMLELDSWDKIRERASK